MKLIVTGKGGSGKSTLSAILARKLSKKGLKILVVDADESNMGLSRMMGLPENPIVMDQLGGKKEFKKIMNQSTALGGPELFETPVTIGEIPKEWISEKEGITLLSIGKIHAAGEGCACPMGVLSRMVLSKLVLHDTDLAIIDTTAGIEHFGRGIDEKCDYVVIVVDPSHESFALAKKISGICRNARLDYGIILSKASEAVRSVMLENVEKDRVIGTISDEPALFLKNLKGEALDLQNEAMESICDHIMEKKRRAC